MSALSKFLFQILAVLAIVIYFSSCEDEKYFSSNDAHLEFSQDTIMFDTIFTTIGSTTKHFKVYNPYNESILISRIRLAGGDFSNFRLNINGIVGSEAMDLEIPAHDSIFIFVEVTIDPNGQSLPMVVKDSIIFTTNMNVQDIDLIAWGQDFNLIRGKTIQTSTWTNTKPYLVYNYAYVDSLETLTIEAGTQIYFHKDAGMYVKGNIVANGTFEDPIVFQADRLEEIYEDVPDQWNGVLLYSGSYDNVLDYVQIKNANIGLQVGTIEHEGKATLNLSNSRIENMAYAGIFAIKSDITGYNNLIANCGFYAAALLVGGNYEFYHSTIANYWGEYSTRPRNTASLVVSNVLVVGDGNGGQQSYVGDLNTAIFGNCIIYGNNTVELELGQSDEAAFNYLFDNCIIQIPDSVNTSDNDHYKNVLKGPEYDPLFVDPFEDKIYELDTLSPAKDIGSEIYSILYPLDLNKQLRSSDDGPDLGAFERIEKKDD